MNNSYSRNSSMDTEEVSKYSDDTVLLNYTFSKRDHYFMANELLTDDCEQVFLMQRSSTFLLGPEKGWDGENEFYESITRIIRQGKFFFHIICLDGIRNHLKRNGSCFPHKDQCMKLLNNFNNFVALKQDLFAKNIIYLKKQPQEGFENDFKTDRQARVMIVKKKNEIYEGVLVWDLGSSQSSFHLRGPKMKSYFQQCLDYYNSCKSVEWDELLITLGITR